MSSLQDQLLKAGLVSKDKATKAKSAKRKQAKINRKHKIESEGNEEAHEELDPSSKAKEKRDYSHMKY